MKRKSTRIEGVSLNLTAIAGMSKDQWMKHGKDSGYFALIGNNTPTQAEWEAIMSRTYTLAQEKAGTVKPVVKTGLPDKEK